MLDALARKRARTRTAHIVGGRTINGDGRRSVGVRDTLPYSRGWEPRRGRCVRAARDSATSRMPVPEILAAEIPEILAGQMTKKAGRSGTVGENDREICTSSRRRVCRGEVPVRI